MLLAERLVAFGARLSLAGDLAVGLGVLDLPTLPNEGAGKGGHLGRAGPAGGPLAPRSWGVPRATPLPVHPGRRNSAAVVLGR